MADTINSGPQLHTSVHNETQQLINDAEVAAFIGVAEFVTTKGHPELAQEIIEHFLEVEPYE